MYVCMYVCMILDRQKTIAVNIVLKNVDDVARPLCAEVGLEIGFGREVADVAFQISAVPPSLAEGYVILEHYHLGLSHVA